MNHFILILLSSLLLLPESNLNSQTTRKVLFLGNSYTGVNNLPQIVYDAALSAGDTLIFDSYTPGGYHLVEHGADSISINKIMAGGWNYIVLQGQSQEPITNYSNFSGGGRQLNNLAAIYNPCSVTMLYMTWGRKNGDASNCPAIPVMCTYEGMDSTLRKNYLNLASSIKAEVSPVSVVWNYLRHNYPGIELYQTDESHPSAAGSYAAACCFYTALFKKDPSLITFDFGLNAADASIIRDAVKTQVFDSLNLWDYKQLPVSGFRYRIGPGINEVIFSPINYSLQETYLWDFGDGDTASSQISSHSYLSDGTYTVSFTTTNCDLQGLHTSTSDTIIQFCSHTPTVYTIHSWLCNHDTIWTQPADSYQWFNYGLAIPETSQYMPHYYQYTYGNLSVLATVNGCTELSAEFTEMPESSNIYFDIWPIGDPCIGDTVPFVVLNNMGPLSGFEIIEWYKNDTLLTFMANEDTLLINSGGIYECKVVDPNALCSLDTTSFLFEFDCSTIGIEENVQEPFWSIFPNPASETITVKFTNNISSEQIQIYNAIGSLTKVIEASGTMTLSISDLSNGLYFVRLKNTNQKAFKLIKQ